MSRLLLAGGRIVDPANRTRGEVGDLHIEDGRIVDPPEPRTPIDRTYDLAGRIVMPGGIDIHSHIAGGKVNLARALMPHDHRAHPMPRDGGRRSGGGRVTPSTFATGYRYAELGYTAAFEPAMVAANARHAHAELADTPMIDKGCYVMLGNDDRHCPDQRRIRERPQGLGVRLFHAVWRIEEHYVRRNLLPFHAPEGPWQLILRNVKAIRHTQALQIGANGFRGRMRVFHEVHFLCSTA